MSLGLLSHRPGWPSGVPQSLRGRPITLIDTTMTGDSLDISAIGSYAIEGNTWETPNATATTLVADASGVRMVGNNATGQRLLIEIPKVGPGSMISATVEWEITTMASSSQSVWAKLTQADALTNTAYDVLLACYRHSGSSYRPKHGYRNSSNSLVTAYTADNPWASSQPSTVTMQIAGSGYSWRCAMSNVSTSTTRPTFRGLAATANALSSLRTRANGQTTSEVLPYMRYLSLGWNTNGNTIDARVKRVIVEAVP